MEGASVCLSDGEASTGEAEEADEEAAAMLGPMFVMDRIMCMPFEIESRVSIDWLGTVPRASTVTMMPKNKIPSLSDFPEEVAQVLAAREARRREESREAAVPGAAEQPATKASSSSNATRIGSDSESAAATAGALGTAGTAAAATAPPFAAGKPSAMEASLEAADGPRLPSYAEAVAAKGAARSSTTRRPLDRMVSQMTQMTQMTDLSQEDGSAVASASRQQRQVGVAIPQDNNGFSSSAGMDAAAFRS